MGAVTSSGKAIVTLPTPTQIHIERVFNAPRHLVYEAWTRPELIKRWWHATVVDVDLRVGGKWRWAMVTDDGPGVAFHGEYREIVPNERIVFTEVGVFEGAPDTEPAVNTMTLTEAEGQTVLTILMQLANEEDRDAIIASGMVDEADLQDVFDLLEGVASSLA